MSLKAFHIVFIAASILLAFGFAAWCFNEYAINIAASNSFPGSSPPAPAWP
jgi:hypothetical protein